MLRRQIIIVSIICLSIAVLVGQTLSQTRRTYGTRNRPDRNRVDSGTPSGVSSSTRRQVTDETKAQSIKGAIGVNDEQWKVIKPRLEKVKQLRRQACMKINTGGGSGGGSQGSNIPQRRGVTVTGPRAGGSGGGAFIRGERIGGGSKKTTKDGTSIWMQWKWAKDWDEKGKQRKDQKLCYELFHLLHRNNVDTEEIKQKIDMLRRAREETKKELDKAQLQLREVLTLDQEARLIALGWLD